MVFEICALRDIGNFILLHALQSGFHEWIKDTVVINIVRIKPALNEVSGKDQISHLTTLPAIYIYIYWNRFGCPLYDINSRTKVLREYMCKIWKRNIRTCCSFVKLEFHDADTDTDTDILARRVGVRVGVVECQLKQYNRWRRSLMLCQKTAHSGCRVHSEDTTHTFTSVGLRGLDNVATRPSSLCPVRLDRCGMCGRFDDKTFRRNVRTPLRACCQCPPTDTWQTDVCHRLTVHRLRQRKNAFRVLKIDVRRGLVFHVCLASFCAANVCCSTVGTMK